VENIKIIEGNYTKNGIGLAQNFTRKDVPTVVMGALYSSNLAHPEGRSSERRTIQPDSKSATCLSTQYFGVLQRPYSLESRGIIVQAVHGVYADTLILHTNCTRNIVGKATRRPLSNRSK
jgi:hypothetical protein